MLNIRVICVGKSKEKYWDAACAEYLKRLRAYCSPEVIEVKEARLPAKASAADDAAAAQWWPLNALPQLAFDHETILRDAMRVMKIKESGIFATKLK